MGPVLTTPERAHRDELIMARMYGLEILRYQTGGHPSTPEKLQDVKVRYPLNTDAKEALGIGLRFVEPMEDDVPTDPREAHNESDSVDEDIADDPLVYIRGEPILPGLDE